MAKAKKARAKKTKAIGAMLHIGTEASAVREARAAILEILRVPHVDNSTKVAALQEFNRVLAINDVSISNNVFNGGKVT